MPINLIRHYLEKISRMKRIGLHLKSKQLPLIEKCISLTLLSVNSVYKFSEMYLSYSLNFTTNK